MKLHVYIAHTFFTCRGLKKKFPPTYSFPLPFHIRCLTHGSFIHFHMWFRSPHDSFFMCFFFSIFCSWSFYTWLIYCSQWTCFLIWSLKTYWIIFTWCTRYSNVQVVFLATALYSHDFYTWFVCFHVRFFHNGFIYTGFFFTMDLFSRDFFPQQIYFHVIFFTMDWFSRDFS